MSGVGGLSSVEEIEQLRRSVAMLAPRHPAALDRELALDILAELQRLQRRERLFSEAIQLARKVLDESDPDGQSRVLGPDTNHEVAGPGGQQGAAL